MAINIIDAPDYNALSQCEFKTDGDRALALSIGDDGVQRIVVGPPQPIRSVSCKGTCVGIYGEIPSFPSPFPFSPPVILQT